MKKSFWFIIASIITMFLIFNCSAIFTQVEYVYSKDQLNEFKTRQKVVKVDTLLEVEDTIYKVYYWGKPW